MKKIKKIIGVAMTIMMVVIAGICSVQLNILADTVAEDVKDARNGVVQLRLEFESKDGVKEIVGGGSAFLINDDTIMSCYHVIHVKENEANYNHAIEKFGDEFDEKKVTYTVVVMDDITIEAKLVKESSSMDFAVLELEQPIHDRTPLKLSNDNNLSETQQIFALGFPDTVAQFQNQNSYTYQDVTISDGRVTKTNESDGVKYVQHSASLTEGYSGGPLVNENGEVVAINRGYVTEYNYSVAISQIRSALDSLGIAYTNADNSLPNDNNDETEEVTNNSEEEDTSTLSEEDTTEEIETTKEAPTVEEKSDDSKSGLDMTTIMIIAAVAVVIIIIIIILILSLGGKKNKQPVPVRGGMNGTSMPGGPSSMPNPQMRQGNAPVPPMPRPSQPFAGSDGDNATTVLSDGGAATTVLGQSQVGAKTIVRVKNGEKIQINRPEFVIGKERRRVDYCVSDNNSVSRTHVKLMVRNGELFIVDMNATNGTFINGTKLSAGQEARISSGDKFKLADEEFQVQ